MKKLMLPLLATALVLVSALFMLSPAQDAEARPPLPHEQDSDVVGVLCWDAHLDVDTDNDNNFELGWNVATGPVHDTCLSVLQDMVVHAWSNGWVVQNGHCYSYTWSPTCRIESID